MSSMCRGIRFSCTGQTNRRIVRGWVFAACVAACSSVHASQIFSWNGGYYAPGGDFGGYDTVNIANTTPGGPAPVGSPVGSGADSVTAGAITLPGMSYTPGTTLEAFCVDISNFITTTMSYNVLSDTDSATTAYFGSLYTGAVGSAAVSNIERYASANLASVTNVDTSAAFQIGLWQIAFGLGFSATPIGATAATVHADVGSFQTAYLTYAGPLTERLTFLEQDVGAHNSQMLVTFTPVPLPASLWLMLSGVAAFMVLGRRGNGKNQSLLDKGEVLVSRPSSD
jgi:hypothetical protein